MIWPIPHHSFLAMQDTDPDGRGLLPAFVRKFRLGFTSGNKHEAAVFAHAVYNILKRTDHPITKKGAKQPVQAYTGTGGTKYTLNYSGPYIGYSLVEGCVIGSRGLKQPAITTYSQPSALLSWSGNPARQFHVAMSASVRLNKHCN